MKVLIIQAKMGIGDMIIYLPYIHAISKKYKKSVSVLVKDSSKAKELLADDNHIDEIIALKKEMDGVSGIFKLTNELKKRNFDKIFIFNSSLRFNLIARFSNIPEIYQYPLFQKNRQHITDAPKKFIKDKLPSNKMIYKPMFGSQGDNIQIIENYSDIENINTIGNIFYIQDFIETNPPHDYRVLAIKNNNKYLMFAMTRHGRNYLNNYSKGAECKYYEIDDDLKAISENIVNIFNIDFCGIDFIKQDGKYFALEVNSIPAWRGIQSVHDNNITDSFVKCMFE